MSSRRAWCQSRLNSSCSRASSSVRLNISLRRWTPRTVCTARLGRPLSTQYMGAKRSSSIRGSASFRKTSAQLLSRRLAFFGVTRNWDCQRLSCGSRTRNILPSLGQAQRPRPFITLSPPCPRLARGFYEQINIGIEVEETIGDAAYGDGATRQAFADAGRTLIAKVPARPDKAHFPKDLEAATCTCPAGQTTQSLRVLNYRHNSPSRLRKKGVSVKLPCRWSQEHDDVRP